MHSGIQLQIFAGESRNHCKSAQVTIIILNVKRLGAGNKALFDS